MREAMRFSKSMACSGLWRSQHRAAHHRAADPHPDARHGWSGAVDVGSRTRGCSTSAMKSAQPKPMEEGLAHTLLEVPIHLAAESRAIAVPDFAGDFDAYVARHCSPEEPGRLVMSFHTEKDWAMWECHPEGDEIVILTSGKAEFFQDFNTMIKRVVVSAGEAIINPKGVPHTANVIEPFTAIYITPCPGTTHRPRAAAGSLPGAE